MTRTETLYGIIEGVELDSSDDDLLGHSGCRAQAGDAVSRTVSLSYAITHSVHVGDS